MNLDGGGELMHAQDKKKEGTDETDKTEGEGE